MARDIKKPVVLKSGAPGNRAGRPKGVPNKSTTLAREAIAKLVDGNAPKLWKWLEKIEREHGALVAWKCVMDVLEYHIPKLARTEHTNAPGEAFRVLSVSKDEAKL